MPFILVKQQGIHKLVKCNHTPIALTHKQSKHTSFTDSTRSSKCLLLL